VVAHGVVRVFEIETFEIETASASADAHAGHGDAVEPGVVAVVASEVEAVAAANGV
jgi:hypothetical protein